MKRILLCLISMLAVSANAHRPEQGKVYAAFGPHFYQTHRWNEQFESPIKTGWTLIAEGDLNKYGGLELTATYMNQVFAIEREDKKVIEQVKRMYIAMGWRHWFSRDFSVSPSFFSSYVMGDAVIVRNDFVGLADPPHTSARDAVDYGIGISAQLEAFQFDRFGIIIDGRYSYSLTPKSGENMNTYGLMVGFKYFIQGRESDDPNEL